MTRYPSHRCPITNKLVSFHRLGRQHKQDDGAGGWITGASCEDCGHTVYAEETDESPITLRSEP